MSEPAEAASSHVVSAVMEEGTARPAQPEPEQPELGEAATANAEEAFALVGEARPERSCIGAFEGRNNARMLTSIQPVRRACPARGVGTACFSGPRTKRGRQKGCRKVGLYNQEVEREREGQREPQRKEEGRKRESRKRTVLLFCSTQWLPFAADRPANSFGGRFPTIQV